MQQKHEGLQRMEKRVTLLQDGGYIPVLEREKTVRELRIYGFEPSEEVVYTYVDHPTGMVVDQEGTLYMNRRVDLVKPMGSTQWKIKTIESD